MTPYTRIISLSSLQQEEKNFGSEERGQWPEIKPTTANPGSHSSISISIHRQPVHKIPELIRYFYAGTITNIHKDFTSLSVGHKHTLIKSFSALEALRNALYKFKTYLLTYTLDTNKTYLHRLSFLPLHLLCTHPRQLVHCIEFEPIHVYHKLHMAISLQYFLCITPFHSNHQLGLRKIYPRSFLFQTLPSNVRFSDHFFLAVRYHHQIYLFIYFIINETNS